MIPIIYKAGETDFTHNGLGLMTETIAATVTEERNGLFELAMVYPIDGHLYDGLVLDSIIKVKVGDTRADQRFAIYSISKPTNGKVTIKAKHISYDLNANPLKSNVIGSGFTAQSSISAILKNTVHPHEFTAWSNITSTNNIDIPIPAYAREALGGIEGSVLDKFRGEYEFDNTTVKLWADRGQDNGVIVAYGKNLTTAEQEEAIDDTFTSLYPFATVSNSAGDSELITLKEYIVKSDYTDLYRAGRSMMVDFTSDESVTDEATLRKAAEVYVKNNDIGKPSVNLKVSFVNLWQTESYKDVAALETVELCDTVTVYFEKMDISTKAKVIRIVYNVLLEKYDEIELGDAQANLADQMNQQTNQIEDAAKSNAWLSAAIANATNLITNSPPGHVQIYPSLSDPQELLILIDATTVAEAKKLWRFNAGGLGFSKNGYNGPYGLAMTADGAIVASAITTETLRGIDIEGVNITGSTGIFDLLYSAYEVPHTGYKEIFEIGKNKSFSLQAKRDSKNYPALQFRMNSTGDLGFAIEALNEDTGTVYVDKVVRISPYAGIETPMLQSIDWLALGADPGGKVMCIDRTTWVSGGGSGIKYIPIRATTFESMSTSQIKEDIHLYKNNRPGGKTAAEIIEETHVYTYKLKDDEEQRLRVGFIAEQASDEVTAEDGKAVDLYNSLALMYQYAKENEKEKQVMRSEIDELKQEIKNMKEVLLNDGNS
ncbi:phage tail spike protein [Listeria ilorinensis]|uniref:phage tail spike protein n=1 Tax=Listeria ilorinensis TaxID=2867439 RepID=UPI001EF6DE01|nr:phage tail spike protein [Listeria ilorinensis]